jgi:adenylosuccinate synthase
MYDFEVFENKFRSLAKYSKTTYSNLRDIDIDAELERYKQIREQIKLCVKDATYILNNIFKKQNQLIIIEGANAAMLDIDFGTYPYVTSSSCTIGGVCSGLGIQPSYIGDVIAIVKAYTVF